MTELATCSYLAWRPGFGQPVVRSLQLPRWIGEASSWPRCILIAPRRSYFRADDWEDQYRAQLARYGAPRIGKALEAIAREHQAERLVLMCFEAEPERCHRGRFASSWIETTGERITELIP